MTVEDPRRSLGFMGATTGKVAVVFEGAMLSLTDTELIDFLTKSRRDMSNWSSLLRHYQAFDNELEQFRLSDLAFDTIDSADKIEDIKFVFQYRKLQRVAWC